MGDEADVFISYKRSDRARVALIADALIAQGISVWLDARLEAGEAFDAEITRHLRSAKAVLVCWSKASVESQWVRAEATEGRESGRLVAVMLESCRPYPPFNLIHMEDLTTWRGDQDHAGFQRMIGTLARKANRKLVEQFPPPTPPRARRSWLTPAIATTLAIGVIATGYFMRDLWLPGEAPHIEAELITPAEAAIPQPNATPPATTVSPPPQAEPVSTQSAPPAPRRPLSNSSWGIGFDANGALEERFAEQTRSSVAAYGVENVVSYTIRYNPQDDSESRQRNVDAVRAVLTAAGVPAGKIRTRRNSRDSYAVESSVIPTCRNTSYYSDPAYRDSVRRDLGVTGCND